MRWWLVILWSARALAADDLESFVDAEMRAEVAEKHIAGAAVAVVKDGRILFQKGYGLADVARRIPVDPERTLFRIASVSKTFMWTAVMQLVEAGKIDLDEDVNRYLDFVIPPTFAPITMRHLLTHTPGFEDREWPVSAASAAEMDPLGVWLKKNLPLRAWAPGKFIAYSNYGAALAGYIVERVSGLPYDDYLEQKIFAPLQLRHITSRQPAGPDLAIGYTFENGGFTPRPFAFVQGAPTGSISASAADMARFALAHLEGGILKPETLAQMHARQFTHDPRLEGRTFGFHESLRNGVRAVGHSGGLFHFYSRLILVPDEHLGIFVAYNTQTARPLVVGAGLYGKFLDHFHPASPPNVTPHPSHLRPYAGEYWPLRRSLTTCEKIGVLLGGFLPVTSAPDGALVVGGVRFAEESPGFFREQGGWSQLVFRDQMLFLDDEALERAHWFEQSRLHYGLLCLCALLFLPLLLVRFLRRKSSEPPPARWAWWCAFLQASAFFAYGLCFWRVNLSFDDNPVPVMTGHDRLWQLVGVLAWVNAALAAACLLFAVLVWQRRYFTRPGRIYFAFASLASAAFVWFLSFWNLLGCTY